MGENRLDSIAHLLSKFYLCGNKIGHRVAIFDIALREYDLAEGNDERPKMSLYQILDIRNQIDAGVVELARDYDLDDETFDQMFFDKVDDTIAYIRELETRAKVIEEDVQDLIRQRDQLNNKAKRIRESCERAMKAKGFEKVAGKQYRVFIQSRRCPASVELKKTADKATAADRARWPQFIKAKYEPSKSAILAAWKQDPKSVPEELASIVTDKVSKKWKFERKVSTDGKGKTAGRKSSKSKSGDAAKQSAAATNDGGKISAKSGDSKGVSKGPAGSPSKSAVS